ncbi:hypothetical protein ACJJIK_15295 [Microbulbifer sp. ZKSA006]|uniref:hypothetical protein n=1 Tax=Microbulbifer sp. ZKSA006 TaxID=3243390 RepID=UPI00403A234A
MFQAVTAKTIDTSALLSLIKDFDTEMLNDEEWDRLNKVDPSDEAELLEVFNESTVPEYRAMDSQSQDLIKISLKQALASSDFNFATILDSVEMPFEPIENPKRFFSLLWLALFKDDFSG